MRWAQFGVRFNQIPSGSPASFDFDTDGSSRVGRAKLAHHTSTMNLDRAGAYGELASDLFIA